jgi:hypothetical protein
VKLIDTSPVIHIQPAPPVPAEPVSDYQVAFVADKPDVSSPIVWSIPLTWKMAGLPRPDLSMSDSVRDWCKYSTLFSNWLYTCLSLFVAISDNEIILPVPDQFIEDLDRKTLTLTREGNKIHLMI